MAKAVYHLHLKGYVGGEDFDRNAVDNVLAQHNDKQVNVLIDSTGGSLATGLSISSAFKNHGNVTVHFVGLNASAATIASLGASKITMDANAMYLAHQCSMPFFEWGMLNSDNFSSLIAECEKIKADLDKLDLNVARMYAAKCKRPVADLLDLMRVGGWLTADEALEWGFIDEITDWQDEEKPELTDALASAMASVGMPIPNVPVTAPEKGSALARFFEAFTALFKHSNEINNSIPTTKTMKKTYNFAKEILGDENITLTDGACTLTESQLDALENHFANAGKTIAEKDATISEKEAEIASLNEKLEAKPAATSPAVVDDSSKPAPDVENDFISTGISATKLFNSLP
ncbi:MAG: Clp protease ClpP [Muribaculaceae bacterium]|nr:Clp protease ClpP [Muribaculaceae bacterium]